MPLPSVVIVYVRCFSLSFEFELSQSLDQSPNFPLHSLSSYSDIKEKREAGQASQESVLEMQNWCENQVNSAFLDETKCLLTNHFVNAKYLFEYRNKVTESYMEKC